MGKSILGILAIIVLQIAFVTYIMLDSPADATVNEVVTNAGAPDLDLSILDELDSAAPSAAPAAAAIDSPPSPRITKVKTVTAANIRRLRRPASQDRKSFARAFSHRPRAQYALHPVPRTYVRRQFFGRWVVETTYYGISNTQAKNISKSKKRPNLA